MTIIVYDQNALITDSYGVMEFTCGAWTSYQTNKIHVNKSGTVAMAYCGEAHDDVINDWFFKHVEAHFALIDLTDLMNKTSEDVVSKVIRALEVILEKLPSSPAKFNSGIAISRSYALQFNKNGFKPIMHQKFNGEGVAVDAYWLMRRAGMSPAVALEKISQISSVVGGGLNMHLQSSLQEMDFKDYSLQIIGAENYEDLLVKDLTMRALQPKTAKRKGK